jgi:GlpG protein
LVTPIFLHLNPLHLMFNMLMLVQLGGSVEVARGKWRYLLIVLVTAVVSNVAEYFVSFSFHDSPMLDFQRSPSFGGMSGVLYGLFGYAWMKSRLAPEAGLHMPRETVMLLMGWLVLCMTGGIGSVANVAHLAGLVAGVVIGCVARRR